MNTPLSFTIRSIFGSINRPSLRRAVVLLATASFAFSPPARAVTPAPDGGYFGENTAEGTNALFSLTSARGNTAIGYRTLYTNTTGGYNTATGFGALEANTTGTENTASGLGALSTNSTGSYNTANGLNALAYNTIGNSNTAHGINALINNTTGNSNVALGDQAGFNLTTGSNNIMIGAAVRGAAGEANKIRIGKNGAQTATYIAGIYSKGYASATGVAVKIDSTGKLGTVLSSARYKNNIKPMEKASEALLKLEPVTFRYKEDLDSDGVPQFGLIAEEVEKVDPNLVVRDEDGKASTVRYEAINAMLLNEFLKEHQKVAELKTAVAKQEAKNAEQQQQIASLAAGLQKVSALVKLSKGVPTQVAATR